MSELRRGAQAGFTIVELLITLIVVGLAFSIFSSLHDSVNSLAGRGQVNINATDTLNRFVQYYQNQKADNLPPPISTPAISNDPYTETIDANTSSDSVLFKATGAGADALTALKSMPKPAQVVVKTCFASMNLGSVACGQQPTKLKAVTITLTYGNPSRTKVSTVLVATQNDGGSH